MLEVKNISFNYPGQNAFKGLNSVSFTVNKGELLSFLGPSGGGKTTLIKCIYGLEDLQSGEIFFNGEKVLGPAYNLMPGHADMKLVSQDYYVLDNHSVEENVRDILIGFNEDYKSKRSAKLLKLLELNALKHLKAKNLSSGQKQRVAIARALAIFPKLLLLDEPFSNLDKILRDKLFDFIIKEARKKHSGVILITHQAEEALKYSDRIGLIINGKIAQIGKKEQVYYKPKNLKIAKTLGDYNILEHDDFEKSSSYYKSNRRSLIRPNLFSIREEKKGADLGVRYLNHFFNGKCFEVLCETRSGREMIFYTSELKHPEEKFFLKISN